MKNKLVLLNKLEPMLVLKEYNVEIKTYLEKTLGYI